MTEKRAEMDGSRPAGSVAMTEQDPLAPLLRRSALWKPDRCIISAWSEHVPFAFWLVDVLRPRRIVELGAYSGVSYSAMCQAVKTLALPTSCYAVDTWKGDDHGGFYGEDIYAEFAAFHDRHYSAFSRLVRSTFDAALSHFDDGSIDLLHIDGFHGYEAVKHDYESWLPKLSPGGVVLFHDTNVREFKFGVFRLWRELAARHKHFEFLHCHGLGVLGLGQRYDGPLGFLFSSGEDEHLTGLVREVFAQLGQMLSLYVQQLQPPAPLASNIAAQQAAEAEREIIRLRQSLAAYRAHASALEAARAALYASTSWRVTAPLRYVSTLFGGRRLR